jgi:hypothetical protein
MKWHGPCSGRIDKYRNRSAEINRQDAINRKERRSQKMAFVRRLWLGTAALFLSAQVALAAGGGGEPIVIVADSRKLSGIMAWWANLYNESHLYFTILTVILIPVIGVVFGVLADIAMHFVGIDLSSRDLAEH